MDVTPGPKMFAAMKAFVDATAGEEPAKQDVSSAATKIRNKRVLSFDFLYQLVATSMREGVNRAVIEARQRQAGIAPVSGPERDAEAKGKDDAQAGASQIIIPGAHGRH